MSVVVWSGGCDSTVVLLTQAAIALREVYPVRAISFSYDQIPAAAQQKAARQRLLKVLRRRGLKIDHTELVITREQAETEGFLGMEPSQDGLTQPVVWISLAQLFLKQNEDLYLGYIRGDDVWHYRSQLINAFDSIQQIQGKVGKILFPLEWVSKCQVIKELREAELLNLVWFCEGAKEGDERKCGHCHSCISHATGEFVDNLESSKLMAKPSRRRLRAQPRKGKTRPSRKR